MSRGVEIPWVGWIDILWVGGRYTMDRAVKIPWVEESIYIR
jgi:hypothetical protein